MPKLLKRQSSVPFYSFRDAKRISCVQSEAKETRRKNHVFAVEFVVVGDFQLLCAIQTHTMCLLLSRCTCFHSISLYFMSNYKIWVCYEAIWQRSHFGLMIIRNKTEWKIMFFFLFRSVLPFVFHLFPCMVSILTFYLSFFFLCSKHLTEMKRMNLVKSFDWNSEHLHSDAFSRKFSFFLPRPRPTLYPFFSLDLICNCVVFWLKRKSNLTLLSTFLMHFKWNSDTQKELRIVVCLLQFW